MNRRTFLQLIGLGATGAAVAHFWPDEGMLNPCYEQNTPENLLEHDLVLSAWEGIDPTLCWDVHTHLIGIGDSNSGIYVNPAMQDIFSPAQFIRFKFYLNASCAGNRQGIDIGYMYQLDRMLTEFPAGAKSMLLAFDYRHYVNGAIDKAKSPFYTPDHYAQQVAQRDKKRYEWIASIHPYREDCVQALESAVSNGARAVKWLPAVMNIDPSSPKCDRFYEVMQNYDIPLLTHAGDEHAVDGIDAQNKGNPLLLRRALDHGVRVIVAHCASQGLGEDLDHGRSGSRVDNFSLFARMMDEKQYEGRLFGDLSAMTQLNRVGPALQTVIQRDDWHHRLLNGSDYPLPGVMPLYATSTMHELGYITAKEAEVLRLLRQYNPLLFDFTLKRRLRWQGKALSTTVFETRDFFNKNRQKQTA